MTSVTNRPPLVRPRRAVLGGVSTALSAHLGWSVRRVRWVLAILTVCGGAGILFYLWLWAFVPIEAPEVSNAADDSDPTTEAPIYRRAPMAALFVVVAGIAAVVAFASLGRVLRARRAFADG